ncbi:MAG: hydrogen gas-evolving membrane-bound hydrogenase subunit E [Candidatus Ratteibacteria bacterium]
MVEIIVGILLIFMIIGSIISLETKDLLSSVIAITAVGYFLVINFLLLGAPDIAITQMVVEVLSLIILIRATIRRDITTIEEDRDFFGLITTFAFIFVFFIFSMEGLRYLPPFGKPSFTLNPNSPSNRYLLNGVKETGATNIVSSIILDYRGYDTLGEATILFTSILGALAILRIYARKRSKK